MSTLKELVGPGQSVHFQLYRKGELHKAMLFMRYIRKQLEANAQGAAE